jgi:hypothetical protein
MMFFKLRQTKIYVRRLFNSLEDTLINLVIWVFWGVAIFGLICLVVLLTVYIVRARRVNSEIKK